MIPIKIAVGALLLVVLCCGMLLLWSRYRQRRLLLRLQQMLDEAIAGTFTEHSFDETMLSALESRMADYLSASATTAMQLQKEKDTIKELISDISIKPKRPLPIFCFMDSFCRSSRCLRKVGNVLPLCRDRLISSIF